MSDFPSTARVVIIGGGVMGVSLLYHLAKEGWKDLVLIEKGELTSGSTWHAAGQCPHFIGSLNMAKIHNYGTELYAALEAETGQATGWHGCGGLRLALTDEEVNWFHYVKGIMDQVGAEMHVIGPDEIRQHHPHLETFGVKAAALTITDGHVDPTSGTNAMAAGARQNGATIKRHVRVTDTKQLDSGEWKVFTDHGDIVCDHLVNAAGSYSEIVGSWVGLTVPVTNMVHQYVVTDGLDEVKGLSKELPVVRDPYSHAYLRQEQAGLLIGPYETVGAVTCFDDGVPWDFEMELLPPELDRLLPFFERASERLPLFGQAGIRRVISGAITHTPDSNFLLGPAAGLKNYWMCCGASIGISQGPGAGKYLAQQMVHGQSEINMLEFDPRRFGGHADADYTKKMSIADYQHMYHCYPPGEQLEECRPIKTTPLYDVLDKKGAQWSETFGWERPSWFSPSGEKEIYSFRRSNWFDPVGAECQAVRERVGILDLSGFAKFDVTGPGATAFLDRIFANAMPKKTGRVVLAHWLTEDGVIEGEATITRLAEDCYYIASAATAELRDQDMLHQRLLPGEDVTIQNITQEYGVIVLSGPKARDVLEQCTDADLTTPAFPWLSAQEIDVVGVPLRALRVSYVGELGWELHAPMETLATLYDALWAAGEAHGIADFGLYAMNSLRMEKGYRGWGSELTSELTPYEAGLDRFVSAKKDYVGSAALAAKRETGDLLYKLVYLDVDAVDADVRGNEPVYQGDSIVGVTTSGAYGFATGKSLAFAFVPPDQIAPGTEFQIDILGSKRTAIVIDEPAYDPENARLRA